MSIYKKAYFASLLGALLLLAPVSYASADGGRFFVKATSGFLKNAIGARNEFKDGFTADLSDFQIGFLKLFRVDLEPVAELHILPDEVMNDFSQPLPTPTPKFKAIRNKKGTIVRYLPSDQTPWGIETAYQDLGVAKTFGGAGVKVAVLDSGVNVNHPDLKNRIAGCKDFTNFRFPVVNNQCDDKNGHGTHVAGIIAADSGSDGIGVYGIAPAASILAYKVCSDTGSCYADDIAIGLKTAVNDGVQVVNMSFGTDVDVPLIADAVNYAAEKGVLMVAAAGNDGPYPDSIDYPSAYKQVIAVGALNRTLSITGWSSRGDNSTSIPFVVDDKDIEFASPGENIESTWKNGGYAILSGTSMASPFVAGFAAKFWKFGSSSPAIATRDYLHTLAKDLSPIGDDNDSGFGLPLVPIQ